MTKMPWLQFLPAIIGFAFGFALNMGEKTASLETLNKSVESMTVKLEILGDKINLSDKTVSISLKQLDDQQKFIQLEIDSLEKAKQ